MEINLFFEPVNEQIIDKYRETGQKRVADLIEIYSQKDHFPDISQFQLAIFGVCEDRQAINNEGSAHTPDIVREQ